MEFLKFIHALGKLFSLSDEILVLIFDEVLCLALVVSALVDDLGLSFHEVFPLRDLKWRWAVSIEVV